MPESLDELLYDEKCTECGRYRPIEVDYSEAIGMKLCKKCTDIMMDAYLARESEELENIDD